MTSVILMDAHSTIVLPSTPFSDMLHSCYAVTIHLCQLAMNFIAGNMFYPQNQNTLQTFSWRQVSSAVSIVYQLIQ